jgi:hypothetical protein
MQKVRARVSPLIELRDPDIFEVILTGNNMLPLVKRRSEFVQLSQELHGMNIGTPALKMHQQDPCLAAQDIQKFLDALLATIGIEDDSAPCRLLKSFMGLWAPQSAEAQHFTKVDDFRANAEGTGTPCLLHTFALNFFSSRLPYFPSRNPCIACSYLKPTILHLLNLIRFSMLQWIEMESVMKSPQREVREVRCSPFSPIYPSNNSHLRNSISLRHKQH